MLIHLLSITKILQAMCKTLHRLMYAMQNYSYAHKLRERSTYRQFYVSVSPLLIVMIFKLHSTRLGGVGTMLCNMLELALHMLVRK